MKIGSLFHNTFYNLHNGNKWTTLHVMNAVEIYERCKSRKLITSFNRSGLCISYGNMKKYRNDLDKFAISNSSEFGLLILSHFPSITFTISAFDNFDHVDKNTLSGKSGSYDTVITLFQETPTKKEMKHNRSKVNLAATETCSKLACQELVPFSADKTLTLPESFIVETETYHSNEKKNYNQLNKFLWSCLSCYWHNWNWFTDMGWDSSLVIRVRITTDACCFFTISFTCRDWSCNCIHCYAKLCEIANSVETKIIADILRWRCLQAST